MVVNLYGNDLDNLDNKAQELAAVVSGIPGAVVVRVASPPGAPQMIARLRPEKLRQVRAAAGQRGWMRSRPPTKARRWPRFTRAAGVIDVSVILESHLRQEPEGLESLMLRNASRDHGAALGSGRPVSPHRPAT